MGDFSPDRIAHLIELRGVYDGWSIAVLEDGSLINRWAGPAAAGLPGNERRFEATEEAIERMREEANL